MPELLGKFQMAFVVLVKNDEALWCLKDVWRQESIFPEYTYSLIHHASFLEVLRWSRYGLTVDSIAKQDLLINYMQERLWSPPWVEGLILKEGVDVYIWSSFLGRALTCFSLPFFSSSAARPSKLFGGLIYHQRVPANKPDRWNRGQNNSHCIYSTIYGNAKENNRPKGCLIILYQNSTGEAMNYI